jgi:hypothetical protein
MKMLNRLVLVAGALLLVSAELVVPARAMPSPFIGAWSSTDVDGSYQTLTIGGGSAGSYHVRYHDFGATACGLDPIGGAILYAASARGALTASGDVLSGMLPVYCQTRPPSVLAGSPFTFQFTYDVVADTLEDSHGVIWSRK